MNTRDADMIAKASISIPKSRLRLGLDWGLRGLIAAAFLAAGVAKLAGAPALVAIFDQIGVGQWFRFVVAAIEIGGALLVILPRTAAIGAGVLTITMAGAVFTHLVLIGGSPVPAILLLALNATTLWLHRARLAELLG